jgi:hypothetical protein
MHLKRKNPKNADLGAILENLTKSGISFILVGGLAAVVQGAPITTMDVDIVYQRSLENEDKLYAFLKSLNAFYRRPDDKIIEPGKDDFTNMGHALFMTDQGPIDVLSFIEGNRIYEDLIEHTVEFDFRGYKINVLDLKIIVELKKLSNDPKDRQRLPVLEETLRQMERAGE